MSIDTTLAALRERRDFYAAAVAALEKVKAYEAKTEHASGAGHRRGRPRGTTLSAEQRATLSAKKRAWWAAQKAQANGIGQNDASVQ